MNFCSTRNNELKVSSAQAIVKGLAVDGGLFVPESFPAVSQSELNDMITMSYPERAKFILGKFLTDFTDEELTRCTNGAYVGKFDDEKHLQGLQRWRNGC